MIATAQHGPAATMGDAIGFYATAIIVVIALAVGLVSLIQWRDRHEPGDSFADVFIPDRSTVAETEASLPDMRDRL